MLLIATAVRIVVRSCRPKCRLSVVNKIQFYGHQLHNIVRSTSEVINNGTSYELRVTQLITVK